ncbi:MAG: M12 family metallo-peptidase [Planctomycetota bacterium]|nr:M12 family metallo-peptidase [Planctomycetota bacterium]
MIPRDALLVSALCVAASATAQETLPFPGDVTLHDPAREVLDFFPRKPELEVLTTLDSVVLTGFPMTDGTTVDLALYRNHIELNNYGFFVDGNQATYDPMDQTLWKGHIVGNDSSDVQLCLASYGCYGWIFDGGQYTHMTSFPGEVGGWANAGGRLYTERALLGAGGEMVDLNCAFDSLPENQRGERDMVLIDGDTSPAGQQLLDLRMAIETDHQYYQNWNNIQACWNYTVNLLDAASDRYESQASVVLTFPYVQLHTNQNDPWTSQDNGGGCGDVLNEFVNAWDNGNIPMDAHLGHMISGANLGCGVAYLNSICSNSTGFAVSGNVNGGLDFPVNQGSNTWDFVVFVHETGHNCGANHTHAYCPPIDECANGPCTNGTTCQLGTNMSYCHTCGGMNNITTYFHPQIVNIIRNTAESSCIPNYDSRAEVTLFADDFESGVMDPAWDTQRGKVRSGASYLSNWGMRIRQNGNATVTVNTTGYDGIKVYYNRRTANLDAGEDHRVRFKVGNGAWQTFEIVETQHWGTIEHELPSSVDNKASVSIRWKNYADEGKERGDIDNVMITGRQ